LLPPLYLNAGRPPGLKLVLQEECGIILVVPTEAKRLIERCLS